MGADLAVILCFVILITKTRYDRTIMLNKLSIKPLYAMLLYTVLIFL